MPQTAAAKKALRSDMRKRAVNDKWRLKVRAALKDVRLALTAKDESAAQTAYHKAQSIMDRAARRNVFSANRVSRKKSRLLKAIQQLQTK